MNENIKVRWLKDNEQTKIAPKTLSSQVYNEDGTLFKDKINQSFENFNNSIEELNNKIENIPSQVQVNWDQNDENAVDFIKNKPFGSTGEYEYIPLLENVSPTGKLLSYAYLYETNFELFEGNLYKIIIDDVEYMCQGIKLGETVFLGNSNGYIENLLDVFQTDLSKIEWGEGEPFCFYAGLLILKNPDPTGIVSVFELQEILKSLDRKYVNYIPGEVTSLKPVTIDDVEYICGQGSEIFNDYVDNKAVGMYSHAEGFKTLALGPYSHAEGQNTMASGYCSHAEGNNAEAIGDYSHAEGLFTIAEAGHAEGNGTISKSYSSHAEGEGTIAIGESSHVQGRYNIASDNDNLYYEVSTIFGQFNEYDGDRIVYLLDENPIFNSQTGTYEITEITEIPYKDLQVNNNFTFSRPESNIINSFFSVESLLSTRFDEESNKTYYKWKYIGVTSHKISTIIARTKLAHIVGNGTSEENRSNAHTLDWEGNAWFQGDIYTGSTSGINMDEGSKKLATEDFVKSFYEKLKTNAQLEFYCIEDVTVIINGSSKVYPANSNVKIDFTENDVFEIVPTSNNSILTLNSFPGALNTFYPWFEGVKQFSNILFDMNTEDMYTKWSQGNQGDYQVQFAQYSNCIFWSDNPYINDVAKRTNYTLYYSSQLPLCYSNIPDNTFKSFYLALGVINDPNWGNSVYRDSFAKATWATQAFSYYGARTIGLPGLDSSEFNIILPKDCRGLMFDARNVENAGTFDAINTTNFGAKSGSWREAFGDCTSLKRLYIKNLKVNLNISWSPIDYNSIYYIISKAANTNKITIFVSPYTYNLLSSADFELAASKNITIALLAENYVEDKRLGTIDNKADKTYVDEKITNLVNSAPEMLDTIGELAKAFQDNEEVIDALNKAISNKIDKEDGKGLSSNDFTDELLEKVNNIESLSAKDWNQNDENHPEYIQNRPFYETGEFNDIAIIEDLSPNLLNSSTCFDGNLPSSFIVGETYKIILDGIEYLCEAKKTGQFEFLGNPAGYFDNFLDVFLGNAENVDWGEQEPFCLYNGTLTFDKSKVKNLKISVYKRIFVVKSLDRKYIDYIPGENVTFKKVNIDDVEYICGEGSEIFNDYVNNIAIGEYSHAEGFQTKAEGAYAHAEGFQTKAEGAYAHAEGGNSYAKGLSSHAEGLDTISSGYGSHAEGRNTESFGLISHAEGQQTIANGEYSHVQGKYNLEDDSASRFTQGTIASGEWPEYDGEKIVYLLKQEPIFNNKTGLFIIAIDKIEEISFKNLQKNNLFLFTYPETDIIKSFYVANDFISTREDEESGIVFYKNTYHMAIGSENEGGRGAKLAHIVGNGANEENRSNAHTLDWEGNAWFQGDVYVGSTSGTNRDEGSKKLLTSDDLVQSDWNQNDPNKSGYIKNRPFYSGDEEFKYTELLSNVTVNPPSGSMFKFCNINPCPDLILGKTYKIIINGVEYIDIAKLRQHSDGDAIYVGTNRKESILDLAPFSPEEGELPFFISTASSTAALCFFSNHTEALNITIAIQELNIQTLDRKYIDYVPGEKTTGKTITFNGNDYLCSFGAEVFNDYSDNNAIGGFSHAEGKNNTAIEEASHAEGKNNTAKGVASHVEGEDNFTSATASHAEGIQTEATQTASHAEGWATKSQGMASHSEGRDTRAEEDYSHAEGEGTVASTMFSHTQGIYNIIDSIKEDKPIYQNATFIGSDNVQLLDPSGIVYVIEESPKLNIFNGNYSFKNPVETQIKDLKENDTFIDSLDNLTSYFEVISTKYVEDGTKIEINCHLKGSNKHGNLGNYAHVVGNGAGENDRSNAHTLDWEGNAWFAGDVYIKSTSGTNRDEGSKKLATEEYINIRVPAWTAEDEGKVLKIVNGTPTWV